MPTRGFCGLGALPHCLELACKNALSSILFKGIEEMLLRLYYVYEKSPKKMRELEEVVKELKEVFEFPLGGNGSLTGITLDQLQAQGTAVCRRSVRGSSTSLH